MSISDFFSPDYLDNILSTPAPPKVFAKWLGQGLGRAVLHLQRHDPAPYNDAITCACLNSLIFDSQLEDTRGKYLMSILDRSVDFESLANRIVAAHAGSNTIDKTYWQLDELTYLLATRGYSGAEDIYFAKAEQYPLEEFQSYTYAVHLNRSRAVEIINDRIIRFQMQSGHVPAISHLLADLAEIFPDETIEQIFANHQESLTVLRMVKQEKEGLRKKNTKLRFNGPLTYEAARAGLANGKHRASCRDYGRRLTTTDFDKLAQDFKNVTDSDEIDRFLVMFAGRRYPLGFKEILKHLTPEQDQRRRTVLFALGNIRHPALHNFAIELNKSGNSREMAILLKSNFQPDDVPVLVDAMETTPRNDEDSIHWTGYSILELTRHFGPVPLRSALAAVYEYTPCSSCRDNAAKVLYKAGLLPQWVERELTFDCNRTSLMGLTYSAT